MKWEKRADGSYTSGTYTIKPGIAPMGLRITKENTPCWNLYKASFKKLRMWGLDLEDVMRKCEPS